MDARCHEKCDKLNIMSRESITNFCETYHMMFSPFRSILNVEASND